MVRLTYVLESPAPAVSELQPVNLAFAAAAVARASWASKDRDDTLWDFEQLDDGVAEGAALGNGGLDGSIFTRVTDNDATQPAPQSRISRAELSMCGVGAATGLSVSNLDAPGIHDIPRNSVLFRTHAAEQTMTSSLPPAEPNAPSAMEVAAVMEERKSRGLLLLPEDIPMPDARVPQRLASFSPPITVGPNGARHSSGGSSGGSSAATNVISSSRKASYNHPYVSSAVAEGDGTPTLSALSASGGMDDRPVGQDADGEGERDGCLVLPVLRTLLAMQDDAPRPGPLRHGNHPLGHIPGVGNYVHVYGHGGQSPGGGYGNNSPNNFGRQVSVHALCASASSTLISGGGGSSIGTGMTRQGTLTSGTASPARRRVMINGGAAAAGSAAGDVMTLGKSSPAPRRQPSMHRTVLPCSPAGYPVGSAAPPDEDDTPGFGTFEPSARVALHNAAVLPISPVQSFSYQAGVTSRYTTRANTNISFTSSVSPFAAGGVSFAGGDASQHGGSATGGRGTSPQPVARPAGGAAAAAVAAPTRGPTKAAQQQAGFVVTQQQQQQQQQAAQQQPSASKNKSGKALFAWTHKLGKGRWSWFPGGNVAATAATTTVGGAAGGPTGGGAATGGAATGVGGLASRSSQDLPSPGVHGPQGSGADGGVGGAASIRPTTAAVAAAARSSSSSDGRSSGIERQSHNGIPVGQQSPPPPPLAAAAAAAAGVPMVPKELVQLPPIEFYARRRPTSGALSPTGLRAAGSVTGPAGAGAALKRERGFG